jgi:hypothetical protein
MSDDRTLTRSSGNVFADAGVPDANTQLVKAQLVSRIRTTSCSTGRTVAMAPASDVQGGLVAGSALRCAGIAPPDSLAGRGKR